ncbi:hypothetical protein I8G32_02337 [Rhodopseudomonas palustris]|uniref:Uncharacterized protein n=1 Tax=Rhodopseudomonas palustris (strain ATCC BAA-98 / CGA009) TaxID=258594 RepID=A0AAE9XZ25_RHOPA|nr:hypothetical protein [Rhodopseudomonas palustris]QQM03794.1 hypothetical protein I8G32_02337 [Rhodopseudomonas palustris]WAB79932.1 hypothetical protein OR798_11765 [Rhodopseudomonas palustris]WCL92435.1 hypothetical protein TX73_011760 [Rhodopseudomonas palustris CGA009]WND53822.1 hypothetical protein L1A21_11720 [Rhodopseudomonas palustris]
MVIDLGTGKIVNSKRQRSMIEKIFSIRGWLPSSISRAHLARNPHKMMVNTIALKTGLYWESNEQLTKTLSS